MRKREEIAKREIDFGSSILEALKLMDILKIKLLLVTKNDQYSGLLSIGDIQRAIINNIPLESSIEKIIRKNIRVSYEYESDKEIHDRMLKWRTELMPILDQNGKVKDVLIWDDVFDHSFSDQNIKLDLPIVIMAGGKGTRLRPLTNIIPKPLVPVGDKSIIENIIANFIKVGCHRFFVTVNYKHKLIENYFEELDSSNFKISFYKEELPLGTAGSLSLLKNDIKETFFISNCDILIDQDYREIYNYHKENQNEFTLVASMKHIKIPYGTVETGVNGELLSIAEKPELTFKINSGMYVLEPHLLKEIPEMEHFHITDLIDVIIKRKGKVGVFPVSEKSWFDIGEWSEYQKTLSLFEKRFT